MVMRRSTLWIALIGAFCLIASLVVASETEAADPFGSLEADLERLRSGLTAAPRSSLGEFSLLDQFDPSGAPVATAEAGAEAEGGGGAEVAAGAEGAAAPAPEASAVGGAAPVSFGEPSEVAGAAAPAEGAEPTGADALAAAAAAVPTTVVSPPANSGESQGDMPGGGVKGGMQTPGKEAGQVTVSQQSEAPKQVEAPKKLTEAEKLSAQTDASRKSAAAMQATTNPADAKQPRPSKNQTPQLMKSIGTVKEALSGSVDSIGTHLNNIVNDVSSIVRTKEQFRNALNGEAGAQAKAFDSAADKIKADAAAYLRGQNARSTKDVLDCTACRFAWMHVEVDMGNTYSEKALYDAFVHHCAEMQMSRIFFSACNDMFVQVDDMIGDYLNGHTVNQLCMNARMCR